MFKHGFALATMILVGLPTQAGDPPPVRGNTHIVHGLKELTDRHAEAIASSPAGIVSIHGEFDLTESAAKALSFYPGQWLSISGNITIGKDAARQLAKSKAWYLVLSMEKPMEKIAIKELLGFSGLTLAFDGLKKADHETLELLSAYKGTLFLDGLTDLDAQGAALLAKHKGDRLSLSGLTELQPGVAENLGRFKGAIRFNGLKSLNAADAEALTKQGGDLSLNGITDLDQNTIVHLAKIRKSLTLDGLKRLPNGLLDDACKLKVSALSFNGLKSLDPKFAPFFQSLGAKMVQLNGIVELGENEVAALKEYQGSVVLDSVQSINDKALEKIPSMKVAKLSFKNLLPLSDQEAETLAKFPGALDLKFHLLNANHAGVLRDKLPRRW